ncbi:MAG: HAMP domain-containing protein [Deltaproteobacteria bacterium]|nr:HAMP domain-containing protein [Deltaproteobacteria bacterium]
MGLRARFMLWFGVAALMTILAAALVTREVITSRRRSEFHRALRDAEADARRELASLAESVLRAVDGLATRDSPLVGGLLVELVKGQGELSSVARLELKQRGPSIMHLIGLDVLTLTAGQDAILCAPHFAAKTDEQDLRPQRLAGEPPGKPLVAWEDVLRDGKVSRVLVLAAARAVSDGNQQVNVLGGKELGPRLLGALGRHSLVEARITDAKGSELFSTEGDWKRLARAPAVTIPLLGEQGQPEAHLSIAIPDDELRRTLRDVTLATSALGILALLFTLLLGILISRSMTKDLNSLVAGAQAVSRGDLEYQVAIRAEDEIGALARAFNAMTRELRDSKDRLVKAERIAAWQEIARSLAHEIKNPLTPIQMSVETLRKTRAANHPSFDEIFDESTRTILEEVGRLKRIVSEFNQFARMPKPERQPCKLEEVVAGALALYRGAAVVREEQSRGLPTVEADRDQLTQVVLNLLENARDAVAMRPHDSAEGRITVRTRSAGGVVELEVEDNGPGFDPSLREKLFSPYFTTKETGTGLGLAIVQRIVTDHGGRVTAHSEPGRGSRFVVELPSKT